MTHPPSIDRNLSSLPTLDLAAIADESHVWVEQQIGNPAGAAERAVAAAEVLDRQGSLLAAAREARDLAAWTVWKQYNVRHGANMPGAIGVQRVAWKKIRDRLDAAQPEPMRDALEDLPAHAAAWARIAARMDAALKVRYAAEDELLAGGMSKAEIARLIGRDPSRVSRRTTDGTPTAA